MSSLWTPEGEHRVPRESASAPEQTADVAATRPGAPEATSRGSSDQGGPSGQGHPSEEELAALEAELLAAPVDAVIANHCLGLFQLAALHLSQNPPRLDEARLAIDAMAAVVEGLGDRLGPSAETLRDALAQIRLAFVQIGAAQSTTNGAEHRDN